MIELMSADEALDAVGVGRSLVCFAKAEQMRDVEQIVSRYVITHGFRVIRVEPSIINAEVMQLSRFPTFSLFDAGSEVFCVVGGDALQQTMRDTIR